MGPRAALSYCLASAATRKPDLRTATNTLQYIVPNARKAAHTAQEMRAIDWVEAVALLAIEHHKREQKHVQAALSNDPS